MLNSEKKYKDFHKEKHELEVLETLATVRQVFKLIEICADNSNNFEEFRKMVKDTITSIEKKMDE